MWPFTKSAKPVEQQPNHSGGFFSTDATGLTASQSLAPLARVIQAKQPPLHGEAMDGMNGAMMELAQVAGVPDAQLYWYGSQGFIGHSACAILAQHWLIDKACSMPARDAIRQGYEVTVTSGDGASTELLDMIKQADKRYRINATMREFIHMGRVFGIRIAIFKVQSTDPEYYEKPFNIDGVTKGSYQGISQVDPTWCTPILTSASLSDPAAMRFYEPEFWLIGGQKYHRSHLAIFIPHPVTDILKPGYQYGGVSVPQRIYERVYAAERTANEGPQLAMTKRMTVLKVNMATAMSDLDKFRGQLDEWCALRDNYGVKVVDKENEDVSQFDTGLADLDATIMTQYQLVAASANVPATKLLGTTPKGFNATGEYEEASYREELESIQANDLTPMLERHHQCVLRSKGFTDIETNVQWMPLDSPTATEWATLNKTKAETASLYSQIGAIDGIDVRKQIISDKDSDYFGLPDVEYPTGEPDLTDETATPDQEA